METGEAASESYFYPYVTVREDMTMSKYEEIKQSLRSDKRVWLVTGVAGFIGSNILEALLLLDQNVVGIDNFSTGFRANLEDVRTLVSAPQWKNFRFVEGDVSSLAQCREIMSGVDHVLHQAALGSIPRSIANPVATNAANVDGFLNVLTAAKDEGVKTFVYATSSSVYGDDQKLPKTEDSIGMPLSPYAASKRINELYASVFSRTFGMKCVGLRYFNVFGKRQDAYGEYSAVIPKWIATMIKSETVAINGDGLTSRDFCYVQNVVQMNILATMVENGRENSVYNVAIGQRTSLIELYEEISDALRDNDIKFEKDLVFRDFRVGDIRHSQAQVRSAMEELCYAPTRNLKKSIRETVSWYVDKMSRRSV